VCPGPATGPGPSVAHNAPAKSLCEKVWVRIESASDDWVRQYAQNGWHIVAVHALHDPASVQVGRDHPGLHPAILRSVVSSPLFQRYMHLELHVECSSITFDMLFQITLV
jgi:hypothetical protein